MVASYADPGHSVQGLPQSVLRKPISVVMQPCSSHLIINELGVLQGKGRLNAAT